MVFSKNIWYHIHHHAVSLDIPAPACGPVIDFGVEISFAHKYGECIAGNGDGDNGMAFLSGKGMTLIILESYL